MGREHVGWQLRSPGGTRDPLTASPRLAALMLFEEAQRHGVAALHPVTVEVADPLTDDALGWVDKAAAVVARV